MIKANKPTGKASDKEQASIAEQNSKQVTEQIKELSEDMEMVSPGAMLGEARTALSLSQEYIANKLNFKIALVNDIEEDNFDASMPITFIRGYLVNYAKLVGVEVEDVLASYDALDAATMQRSEILSFSKATSKQQAEHSRVMWLSYLIVAVLVGLTILWWQQENSQQAQDDLNLIASTTPVSTEATNVITVKSQDNNNLQLSATKVTAVIEKNTAHSTEESNGVDVSPEPLLSEVLQPVVAKVSTAVFTFKGDCWVNIFDATGERIAWGVKKSGYVMTIQGMAPLRITVGKPELTSIIFNGQVVDMSSFNVGNIAKFNLPISE